MPTIKIILASLLPILMVLSALCSASETALFSLTQADRIRLRKSHPRVFDAVSTMLAQPTSLLVAILLLNVTVNTAFFTIFGLAVKGVLPEFWAAIASLAAVLTLVLISEVIPKGLAAVHRVAFCRLIGIPVLAWFTIIGPLRLILDTFVIAPVARLFRADASGQSEKLTSDELSKLVELAANQGVLHASEQQLLADVVQLSVLRVRDIMTPRVDVRWLSATDTSQELLQVARDTGYTRFPVCRGSLSDRSIVGIVHAQRVLPGLAKQGAAARMPLPALVEPARFVPERSRVDQLLEFFRTSKCDAAMVVSEQGEVTGMVQIDNVINELIKFAANPDDSPSQQVQMVGVGEWEVPGRLSVRDWEEFFESKPGSSQHAGEKVSTVAGLVFSRLGRVPREGDIVEVGNVTLTVSSMNGRSIERVRVSLAKEATP